MNLFLVISYGIIVNQRRILKELRGIINREVTYGI